MSDDGMSPRRGVGTGGGGGVGARQAAPPGGLGERLLALAAGDLTYTLEQINGQRVYRKVSAAAASPGAGPGLATQRRAEPSRKCEVFVGRLPHDCFEDELVPLLQLAGELYEFRLMINFSGWNRGYAFAMYMTEAQANNAIRLFDGYTIRPNWQLGVVPSANNCRLYISRIPPFMSSEEVVSLLYVLTEEVKEVRIRRAVASCSVIAEYRSHRGAAMARKALVASASAWGGGVRPIVDWSVAPESPNWLRGYRELGRWTPEHGVRIEQVPDAPPGSPPPGAAAAAPSAPTYTLEPWSQARRMRLIQQAERMASSALGEWPLQGQHESPMPPSSVSDAVWGRGEAEWRPFPGAAARRDAFTPTPGPTARRGAGDFDPWNSPLPFSRGGGALELSRALAALNI